ncbi:myo-inositol-1(or 4)-monophosphatase [Tistlia consotensis]|uniref:Inositol-1-monophosphatase n=1 Tax=Tistlia consotensis USBA 355 TaxID=560819 RepID=A0A1Y6C441_9PROT|nr:inositol monophosphatase family protein [Tistlia consotensis]SMF32944.1 myo-inositol-1(or 4)-monophosphatase [Tistlia consotensis USBA 355]SNR69140.1 myo-inositol-1(or 4)-monophosphatase [Tistlia consotensis]
MAVRSALINVMVRAVNQAARGLKRDFGEVENLQVSKKGPADFVSAADTKAEQVLRNELSRARPDYGFLMEESGGTDPQPGCERRWIVDPLDGTSNFLHGLPHFAISIGLAERDEVIAAVVYDPIKDELFWAEKGGGAFLNDRRLRVSSRRNLSDSLFATGIPFLGSKKDDGVFLRELTAVMQNSAGVRRWGVASLDLAYVAAGRFDGFWEQGLSPWDFAGGILLVREAGGIVTDIEGRSVSLEGHTVLAANEHLHRSLAKLVGGAQKR